MLCLGAGPAYFGGPQKGRRATAPPQPEPVEGGRGRRVREGKS